MRAVGQGLSVKKGGPLTRTWSESISALSGLVGKLGKSKSSTDRSWTKIAEYAAKNLIAGSSCVLHSLQME